MDLGDTDETDISAFSEDGDEDDFHDIEVDRISGLNSIG